MKVAGILDADAMVIHTDDGDAPSKRCSPTSMVPKSTFQLR